MIIMTLRLTVPPKRAKDLVGIVKSMAGPMSVEPACKHFNLFRNLDNNDELMIVVEWTSQEALERHIRSNDFMKILQIMELSSHVPEICFDNVAERFGFDFVESLRS